MQQQPIMKKQQQQYPQLNSQGQNMGKTMSKPTSRIGVNNQKQVTVVYGHEGGGKAYNYLASENLRAGDTVTPEVEHHKSGKKYKTLGRVMSTRDASSSPSGDTSGYLSGQGIMMKTIGKTDQQSLPGYYTGWGKDAKAASELYNEARLGGASDAELKANKSYTSSVRRETKQKYDATMQRAKGNSLMGEVLK